MAAHKNPNCFSSPGIYCLYSKAMNRAMYVGATKNLNRRKIQHKHSLVTGVHTSTLLNVHSKQYGSDDLTFSILCHCTANELTDKETLFIEQLETHVSKGGLNRRILAGTNKGMKSLHEPWNKGKKMTDEYRRVVSESTKRGMANPEVRAKLSAAKKGKPSGRLGHKTNKPAGNTKPIIATNIATNESTQFSSIQVAAQALGFLHGSVSAVCRGQISSLKGYYFKYA
ncbi:group I intron endonuclease [Spirosoma oryzae]|uniref:Group I intron endonuclease n=1 Tax=Spirosoma oryzae TaxID=1469603 RepID=A0A2T0S8P0_9BACT|nr:GIY-YIG nuclease family protein [Spirosoma oryzae]PRY29756.1 group I intron endonuclease [Spirosoma oryzae]